ncbi:PKD domain-containing protein [Cytophagaceae bacterium YF14B1]|uniref:PKD domain-containing protein n=1 Tax=Xanthocytophaga flava TaxID=3048013 RepID=A0AAE3QRW7_9BACT|nr:PKD domain-containing protein [Xanthocytophaga flavus]MDJ1482390.1 PKD domain-containing protein [Xanthocytophaga flavus]
MKLFTLSKPWQVFIVWIIFFFTISVSEAQCPQPGFTLPDTVCIGENITISNTSTGATRYEWDFCSGDLKTVSSVDPLVQLPTALTLTDIEIVSDNNNWYGFASSRDNDKIFRLDFGTSLHNKPVITDLGNPNNILAKPEQIKFIKEGANWYALVTNQNDFARDFSITRLNFGNSLTNIPSAQRLSFLDGYLMSPRGVALAKDGENVIGLIANEKDNSLLIIRFGSSITNTPSSSDILVITNFPETSSGLSGISVRKDCDQWIGVATSYNKSVYVLNFTTSLFTEPTITSVSSAYNFPLGPTRVNLLYEEGQYYAFMILLNGDLVKYAFGKDINNQPIATKAGGFVGDGFGLCFVKANSENFIYTTDFLSNTVYTFDFTNNCSASIINSTQTIPGSLSYTSGGTKYITLSAYNSNGQIVSYLDSIFVRPVVNPMFSVTNLCNNQPTLFTASDILDGNKATSYLWNFGDGQTATGASVQHTYTTAQNYNVTLTIKDICNQTSSKTESVKISRSSTADIELPNSNCSYQSLQFKDASTIVNDPIVKWEWTFSDNTTSTEQNPVHTFTMSGIQTVSLTITGQSGCKTSVAKTITLKEGANTAFSFSQACLGNKTQFIDETAFSNGTSLVSRIWDFGDNSTPSTEQNPSHTYAQTGTYLVKLTIENTSGCIITLTKSVNIHLLPKASFATALACVKEETQFTDESIANDGSIVQWEWNFGDSGSDKNVSSESNPTHAFTTSGTFQVKLKVTNSFGCSDSLTKSITVIISPVANFTFQSNCNTRDVTFTNTSQPPSGSSLTSWYWDFGDNSTPSTEQNPSHTYAQTGTYLVKLTVTAASRCTNTLVKTIAAGGVGLSITPDTSICANTSIQFKANVISSNDAVISWQWDFGTLGKFSIEQPTITIPNAITSLAVSLTVNTSSGCTSTISKNIPVLPSANAAFAYSQSTMDPLTITFVNQSTNANQYIWDFGDNTTSTDNNPIHTFSNSGIYEVILTSIHNNGCESIATQKIPLNISTVNALTVFPNPITKDYISTTKIGFSLPEKQTVYLEMYTITGSLIQKAIVTNTQTDFNAFTLTDIFPNLSMVSKGMYLLILRYRDTVQVQKFSVQ